MTRAAALLTIASVASVACVDGRRAADTIAITEIPELSYTISVRLGSVDDPDVGFSRIGGVDLSASGNVYVIERSPPGVRVFEPDGAFIRMIGREGQGPGEFTAPTSFGLLGDTLWVFDLGSRRISWFGPGGEFLFSTPAASRPVVSDPPGVEVEVLLGQPRPDGLIDGRFMTMGASAPRSYRAPMLVFDRAGEVVDTAGWRELGSGETVNVGGRPMYPPSLRPVSPMTTSVGEDSVTLAWAASGEGEGLLDIVRFDATGDTAFTRTLRYSAMPVPESVRDSLLEPMAGLGPVLGIDASEIRRTMEGAIELPTFRPPVRTVRTGVDESIWIELNTASTNSTEWVLVEGEGALLGRVTLPPEVEPEYSDGATVWAVETDELGVPWLLRLDLQRAGTSSP